MASDRGPSLCLGGANEERAKHTRVLKELVRRHFGLGADDSVFIAKIACGATGCHDVETVIALFLSGRRREFRVEKPIADIARTDLPSSQCLRD